MPSWGQGRMAKVNVLSSLISFHVSLLYCAASVMSAGMCCDQNIQSESHSMWLTTLFSKWSKRMLANISWALESHEILEAIITISPLLLPVDGNKNGIYETSWLWLLNLESPSAEVWNGLWALPQRVLWLLLPEPVNSSMSLSLSVKGECWILVIAYWLTFSL